MQLPSFPSLSFGGMSFGQIVSVVLLVVAFLGGSSAIVAYSDRLPDGSKCYFNTICFVPVDTINAIKSIPEAKAQGLLSLTPPPVKK